MKKVLIIFTYLFFIVTGRAQSIGIGTTTPAASAKLDVTATNKGMLIPRMTAAQRTAIPSPAQGLMVYQTDAPIGYYFRKGSAWQSWGTSTCSYRIGENVPELGGYVFFLDASGCHGLVCATSDQGNSQWYNENNTSTTAFANGVGSGWGNTVMIVFNQGNTGSYAAKLCADLSSGGFTDWYLPSLYELNLIYKNVGQGAPAPNTNVAGFPNNFYWSSSEFDTLNAWVQHSQSGFQGVNSKHITCGVRAIRAF